MKTDVIQHQDPVVDQKILNDPPMGNTRYREEKTVSMRFRQDTLANVEFLKRHSKTNNRTAITAAAIALARFLVGKTLNGGKIYIEYENGEREAVLVVGDLEL